MACETTTTAMFSPKNRELVQFVVASRMAAVANRLRGTPLYWSPVQNRAFHMAYMAVFLSMPAIFKAALFTTVP